MRNNFLLLAAILIVSLCALLPTHIAFANEESEKHNNQAAEYYKTGKYEEAIKEFNLAISINPNEPLYYENRAYVYKTQGEEELGVVGKLKVNNTSSE